MQRQVQLQALAHDGDQHVGRYRDPHLRLDCILGGANEMFYAEMLLDPTKKQFDRPSTLVESADGQCRQTRVIGQKHQRFVGLGVFETDAAQMFWVMLPTVETIQRDRLVADDALGAIRRGRVDAPGVHVPFGAGDKEAFGLMQPKQSLEVEVAAVHDIEGASFRSEDVQHVDVVELPVADVYEAGDRSAQVEQSVQLDRRLGLAKRDPGTQRQAKVYGGGIQRIHGVGQIHCQRFVRIKSPGDGNEGLSELVVNAPVARLVGIGQRAAADVAAYAEVVQLGGLCPQTSFDVAQALAIGKLRKGHAQKLVQ